MQALSYREYEVKENGIIMTWYDREKLQPNRTLIRPYTITSIYAKENVQFDTPCYKQMVGYLSASTDMILPDPQTVTDCAYFTDKYLDSRLFAKDDNSSFVNARLHKSCVYQNKDFFIPTIQCLARIFCDRVFIDSIDPRFHLSDWFKHNPIPFVWSSTQMDWYYMWGITSTGMVCGMGKCDNLGVVIPIVEL